MDKSEEEKQNRDGGKEELYTDRDGDEMTLVVKTDCCNIAVCTVSLMS